MTESDQAGLRVLLWQRGADLDPAANLAAVRTIPQLVVEHGGADLVVLPEASARDFGPPGSDVSPYAEPLDGPFATALQAAATNTDAAVLAGMFETSPDPERPYNTLVLAQQRSVDHYRKIHLYDSFGHRESDRMSPGPLQPVVVPLRSFTLGLMTCYDLRFPELARALVTQGADVLVLPAAWVAGPRKVEQWRTLLRARAVENVCWVVAAGQPGPRYCGHSLVVAPTGDVVVEAGGDVEVISATLDQAAVRDARADNPSLDNRRL